MQECPDLTLDRLGFTSGAAEAEQPIIGIAYVTQASVGRVHRIKGGHLLHLTAKLIGLVSQPRFLQPFRLIAHMYRCRVWSASVAAVVLRKERRFDKAIEPVQVDI